MARRRRRARPARGPQRAVQASFGRDLLSIASLLGELPRSLPVGSSRRLVRRYVPTARTLRSNALYGRKPRLIRDALREAKRVRRMLRSPLLVKQDSLCSRRDRRRQVLHASGVAGVRGGAWSAMMRNARFNSSSFYSCRR